MRRMLLGLLVAGLIVLTGCAVAKGEPKAVMDPAQHDFGSVPVVADMSQAITRTFAIKNEGNAELRLSAIQVKLLQGC